MPTPFKLFPNAKSIAITGLYYLPSGLKSSRLNDYIELIPKCPEIDEVYLPRTDRYMSPTHYLIGTANDDRYYSTLRKINDLHDAESSITLVYLALLIYYSHHYFIGPTFGFISEGTPCAYVLSTPSVVGSQGEVLNDLLTLDPIFFGEPLKPSSLVFDEDFKEFYKMFIKSFIDNNDRRWNLAVIKYVSGITQKYLGNQVILPKMLYILLPKRKSWI
jgi:hypothetical protein